MRTSLCSDNAWQEKLIHEITHFTLVITFRIDVTYLIFEFDLFGTIILIPLEEHYQRARLRNGVSEIRIATYLFRIQVAQFIVKSAWQILSVPQNYVGC